MSFKYPLVLLLIIPITALLLWSFKRRSNKSSIILPFNHNAKKITPGETNLFQTVPLILQIIAITLLVIGLARPRSSSTQVKRSAQGIDIMIAFDVSKSMLIEDRRNESRINLAKETVKNFVLGRGDDRIGFLMFSGESITLCPPTLDYTILEKAIDSANTDQLKDGTAIGDAIASSVNRLKNSNAKSKIIVLLTDGDNNMGSISPLTAGSLAKGYGIKVYSIALGRDGRVTFPQTAYIFGRPVKKYTTVNSTINPKLLKQISAETGGKFYRAKEKESLQRVFAEINQLEKTKIETKQRVNWKEHYFLFVLSGLIIMILNFILERTAFRIIPE